MKLSIKEERNSEKGKQHEPLVDNIKKSEEDKKRDRELIDDFLKFILLQLFDLISNFTVFSYCIMVII